MVDRINQLNRIFTVIFTQGMQSLKPSDPRAEDYSERIEKWQRSFSFPKKLQNYVNDLNNMIVLAGEPQNSEQLNSATKSFVQKLEEETDSDEFSKTMELAKPQDKTDPDYHKKIKAWEKAFIFPSKLRKFVETLNEIIQENKGSIPPDRFILSVDNFIKDLEESVYDYTLELCVKKKDKPIGKQEFEIDDAECRKQARKDVDGLISKVKENPKYVEMKNSEKELFKKTMTNFKEIQRRLKAGNKIIEKKYDEFEIAKKLELDDAKDVKKSPSAKKKTYGRNMNIIAASGLLVIAALMILSITCPGVVDGRLVGGACSINGPNPYTQILESNVMLVLVSTVIAPVAARILKDKFDIDVEAKQIAMIMADGIKSVTMFANEADKLRDENGQIPRKYQKVLRDKAFNAIKDNYAADKYNDLVANVGAQVFEKAIEHAVTTNKIERFPLEKKQVEAIIKQGLDALPQMVEWKDLDEEAKNSFLDGNIRKLLQNAGVEGWSYKALENIFDAEVSKRLLAAAIADERGLLAKIDEKDPNKYTSTVVDAVFTTLAGPKAISGN